MKEIPLIGKETETFDDDIALREEKAFRRGFQQGCDATRKSPNPTVLAKQVFEWRFNDKKMSDRLAPPGTPWAGCPLKDWL